MPLPRVLSTGAALVAVLLPAAPALLSASPAAAGTPVTAAATPDLGYDRIGVRRGDTWRLRDSLDGGDARVYAERTPGWQPVAGDLNGDGTGTVSLFRDGVWQLSDAEGSESRTVRFGQKGDVPVVGDWDGDGVDTIGLFRGGRWLLRSSNAGVPVPYSVFGYGIPGDTPVVGDWDADGQDDIAVRRGVKWYQRDAASSGPSSRTFDFGNSGDLPVAGDWDHDGRDTPGVFRSGTWYFKLGNGFGGYQTTSFGRAGDRPVVRRTPGLAPGLTHRVIRDGASTVHVATVDLSASSSPDAVLSGGDLKGLETPTSMGRRSGAVLSVNADYFLSSGRPVHAMAADGRLLQTPQLLGRAFGLDLTGTKVQMGFPDTRVVLSTPPGTSTVVTRWNSGGPSGSELTGFTAPGAGLSTPPSDQCYAGAATTPGAVVRPDGGVESSLSITGTRCFGPAPVVPGNGAVLVGQPLTGGETTIRTLSPGLPVPMTQYLGFPGAVDVLGGNPLLLKEGVQQSQDLSGSGSFFSRQPRTAVGVTADGRMLIVVVDGRQGTYSAGMTLAELADLMQRLGARDAINLDGGGSSAMYLNGLRASRPSDGYERGVGTALVVLPGGDPGEQDLSAGTPIGSASKRTKGLSTPTAPAPVQPDPAQLTDPLTGWTVAAHDPGSVGGLADALEREGVDLPADLQRADAVFDGGEG